jgi:uncharacterized protein YjbI with pentapeptide repeats
MMQAEVLPFFQEEINPMSEQDNGKVATLQRPTTNDPKEWKAYWEVQGWSWRTEPEIDAERQKYLADRRAMVPDIEQGIYPFRGIKLSRADIEWLLATHDNGQGPVDWSDITQRSRKGLDLRGGDLRNVNLNDLPLSCISGSLNQDDRKLATEEQRKIAEVYLEGSSLRHTHLENADLYRAHLEKTYLHGVYFEHTYLRGAHLENSDLFTAHLNKVNLKEARIAGADLRRTELERADLENICLTNEKHVGPRLVDANWSNTNLTVVKWSEVHILGDEYEAKQKTIDGKLKDQEMRLKEYEAAARANRQLSVILQAQGLNEDAARFAYRGQKLQCIVLRKQKRFGKYFFSLLLDLLAGYGYKPSRSVIWYIVMILGFALTYHFLGGLSLFPPDAFVFSIMSFHGRGFFPSLSSETNLHNPLVMLAAAEAIVGLLIEISFIATFTQRFFGK